MKKTIRYVLGGLGLVCVGVPALAALVAWWACVLALPVLGAVWLWQHV